MSCSNIKLRNVFCGNICNSRCNLTFPIIAGHFIIVSRIIYLISIELIIIYNNTILRSDYYQTIIGRFFTSIIIIKFRISHRTDILYLNMIRQTFKLCQCLIHSIIFGCLFCQNIDSNIICKIRYHFFGIICQRIKLVGSHIIRGILIRYII